MPPRSERVPAGNLAGDLEVLSGVPQSLGQLHHFGINAFSTCLLYDSVRRYDLTGADGFVGYLRSRWLLVALGEPVCAESDFRTAAEEFAAFAAAEGKGCAFVAVGRSFIDANASRTATVLPLGEDFIFDVRTYAPRGDPAKKVRSARNKAIRLGCRVRDYHPCLGRNAALEAAFETVSHRWLRAHSRFTMRLLSLDLFRLIELKRFFWVELDGRVVAFLSCLPIYGRNGYLFEDLVRDPAAPSGATELMVLEAIRTLRLEGAAMATFGLSPLVRVDGASNLSVLGAAIARVGVAAAARFGRLHRLYHYRKKFHTMDAEPCFLWKFPAGVGVRDLWGLLQAFRS